MTNIIGTLPFNLTNNAPNDASQVMADLNKIRNDVNTNAQARGAGSSYRGASVTKSLAQTVNSGATDLITFDTNIIDTDSIHSTSVNTERLTVPSGVSLIRLRALIFGEFRNVSSSVPGGLLIVNSNLNGEIFRILSPLAFSELNSTRAFATPIIPCTAGEYFTLSLKNGATQADDISTFSFFEMEIMG